MKNLPPKWVSCAFTLAYMLTVAIMARFYADALRKGGEHLFSLLGGVFVFPFLICVTVLLFGFIISKLPDGTPRGTFVAVCAIAILAWHGIPGWFAVVFGVVMIVSIHHSVSKDWRNARALEEFDTHGG
jgi:hypothetical protein